MKSIFFFTFLTSLAKAGLWVCLGILIKNHFITLLSLIIRKPIPENQISEENLKAFNHVLNWIGILIIAIGVTVAISSLLSLNAGLNMR